jgi:glycosylphosphatidylinositol transamidase (GPIT) subunit GPI8
MIVKIHDDGDNDVDGACMANDFKSAIDWGREHVKENSPFILYLVGHGERDPDVFFLDVDKSEGFTPSELAQQLSTFPETTRMLIVIDACYSGCFITTPDSISAKNRIIVTSAHDNKKGISVFKCAF